MTIHMIRHDAEDRARTKEKGRAEAQPTSENVRRYCTKKDSIRAALRNPCGLNRFEAERLGDHCLNSTIADLRSDGCAIHSEWETVPTRFNPKGVRVLRYWLVGSA